MMPSPATPIAATRRRPPHARRRGRTRARRGATGRRRRVQGRHWARAKRWHPGLGSSWPRPSTPCTTAPKSTRTRSVCLSQSIACVVCLCVCHTHARTSAHTHTHTNSNRHSHPQRTRRQGGIARTRQTSRSLRPEAASRCSLPTLPPPTCTPPRCSQLPRPTAAAKALQETRGGVAQANGRRT